MQRFKKIKIQNTKRDFYITQVEFLEYKISNYD